MRKVPTLFERDWKGDRSLVLDMPNQNEDVQWVFYGTGIATRKLDGTACLIRNGSLFKRHEVKPSKQSPGVPGVAPLGFIEVDKRKNERGVVVLTGWVPVGDGPEDRWHRQALDRLRVSNAEIWEGKTRDVMEGTYELVGPQINGNPEHKSENVLIQHSSLALGSPLPPREFHGLRDWLSSHDVEGIVWHHPDGRMAKIKRRDFGIKRGVA